MESRKLRKFFRDLKKAGKSSFIPLALLGMLNLFFLPFIHFHPGNTHAHPGEFETHHHTGHFHSSELENIALWANIHPGDPEEDEPLHHSHSSPEHDVDQVAYTTLALHTVDKLKHFSKPDLVKNTPVLQENFKRNSPRFFPTFSPAVNHPKPVQQVRGPPSV
ncbi:MAG: hypothetical protein G3M70_04430 [Candidatus Nitronauta litoralis]|uniref:Uncharacterized protein n=1 Tax=Candidatus Nitronauta litoralis TaxID=2705533 RepID=A0A7T0FZC3_9BACT|nr:MAG: hypothetical protein G3M70_04430 [Candidatus Nitronauta litoralis]